VEQLKRTSLA